MKHEKDTAIRTPDKKISWGGFIARRCGYELVRALSTGHRHVDLARGTWWVGTAIGCGLAATLNWLRPRYARAGRFWKPIYRFLLEQMSPPD